MDFYDTIGRMGNLGGIGGIDMKEMADSMLDKRYKEAKKKCNLKLCKMKSGKYKILDYYNKEVYFSWVLNEAKKKYISLAQAQG